MAGLSEIMCLAVDLFYLDWSCN